jgi:hypothetical protein
MSSAKRLQERISEWERSNASARVQSQTRFVATETKSAHFELRSPSSKTVGNDRIQVDLQRGGRCQNSLFAERLAYVANEGFSNSKNFVAIQGVMELFG